MGTFIGILLFIGIGIIIAFLCGYKPKEYTIEVEPKNISENNDDNVEEQIICSKTEQFNTLPSYEEVQQKIMDKPIQPFYAYEAREKVKERENKLYGNKRWDINRHIDSLLERIKWSVLDWNQTFVESEHRDGLFNLLDLHYIDEVLTGMGYKVTLFYEQDVSKHPNFVEKVKIKIDWS